jgi:predicted RNA-binding Zn ribbon-like protein
MNTATPATFQLLASHPALDFVNTLDDRFVAGGPHELLNGYADLLAFAQQSAVIDARQVGALMNHCASAPAAKALRRARELREAFAVVVYDTVEKDRKPPAACLEVLERHFREAQKHQELVWKRAGSANDTVWQASWQWGRFETDLDFPVWALARSAMDLLTSDAMERVHVCKSETCRWVFLDTSKNHSRRWCDMKICGNRMKARRFQARQ